MWVMSLSNDTEGSSEVAEVNWMTQVAMPPAVAGLPQVFGGIPVPYVAEWDQGDSTEFTTDNKDGTVLHCRCKTGVGVVKLGKLCPTRQRYCMRRWACGICGIKMPRTEPAVFFGAVDAKRYTEPAVHVICGLYAAQVCPGILRPASRGESGVQLAQAADLTEVRVTSADGDTMVSAPYGKGRYAGILTLYRATPIRGRRMTLEQFVDDNIQGAPPA